MLYPMYYCAVASESMSRLCSVISIEGKIEHNPNCPWNAFKSSMSTHARFHICNPVQKSSGTQRFKSLLSCVWLFVTPWTAARQASLSFTIFQRSLKFMSIESVMPSNHLILCCPISPSSEYSGLMSFRIDWFDLLAVHGTLKSLLQHHSSKASILQGSGFFMVQLSHPYMTTGKTIALTIWTFVRPLS